ncbi:MAG: TraR/DksA C4-type zinc finger protein [Bacillota bacterium]
MNSEQLQTIKQTLLEEQDTFLAQIKKHKAEQFDEGELSHYDNHPGDEGSALYDETLRRALTEHDIRHLGDIRHALERMEEGTYHLCEVCGIEINPDRLEALPTTSTCIDHADETLERKMYHESKEGLVIDDVDALEQLQAFGSSDQLSEKDTDHDDPIEKVSSKTKHV